MYTESRLAGSAYPATRWSLVARASALEATTRTTALDELLRAYLPVLRTHCVAHLRLPPHRTDDLLQSFIAEKVLEKNILAQADQDRGRFRSFLLKSLTNYVISDARRRSAKRRNPSPSQMVGIDEVPRIAANARTRENDFDEAWGRQVLAQTIDRMCQECSASGRPAMWRVFAYRVLDPVLHSKPPMPYAELVEELELRSPAQGANLLLTAKRMFVRLLREVVRDTVLADADVDAEIDHLKAVFS